MHQEFLKKEQIVKKLRLQDFREYSKSGYNSYYILYCEDHAGNKYEVHVDQKEFEELQGCAECLN